MFFFADFDYRQCRNEKAVCPRRVILWLTFCKKASETPVLFNGYAASSIGALDEFTTTEEMKLNRLLRRAAHLLILMLLPCGMAVASDLPSRKAGLWIITSKDNPFANWSACIDDRLDNFINSDVWSDFEQECESVSINKTMKGQKLTAMCKHGSPNEVALIVEFSGDFQSRYQFRSTTKNAERMDEEGQTFTVDGNYAGECPADLPPGKKTMTR
ncbi:DUF3617 domain-containing protein [Agrobacterium rosae]